MMKLENMPSKMILTLLCALVGNFISAQELKWYNPENAGCLVVQGQAFSGEARECFYNRLPDKIVGSLPKGVARLSRQTAGESICFTTDSKNITVRYRVKRRLQMHHIWMVYLKRDLMLFQASTHSLGICLFQVQA